MADRERNLFKEREDVQLGGGLSTTHDGPRETCKEQLVSGLLSPGRVVGLYLQNNGGVIDIFPRSILLHSGEWTGEAGI